MPGIVLRIAPDPQFRVLVPEGSGPEILFRPLPGVGEVGVVHALADEILEPPLVSALAQHPHRVVPLLHQVAGVFPSSKIEGAGVLPLGQVPGPFSHLGVVQEDPREHQAVDVPVYRGSRKLIHQVGEFLHLHGIAVGDEHHAVAVVVVDQTGFAVPASRLAPGTRGWLRRCQHPGSSGAGLEKLSSCGHGRDTFPCRFLVDAGGAGVQTPLMDLETGYQNCCSLERQGIVGPRRRTASSGSSELKPMERLNDRPVTEPAVRSRGEPAAAGGEYLQGDAVAPDLRTGARAPPTRRPGASP